jgi:hypothetical protein
MSNATLHRVARNRPAQRLISCSPIAQAIACSLILARELKFRNKIPTLGRSVTRQDLPTLTALLRLTLSLIQLGTQLQSFL